MIFFFFEKKSIDPLCVSHTLSPSTTPIKNSVHVSDLRASVGDPFWSNSGQEQTRDEAKAIRTQRLSDFYIAVTVRRTRSASLKVAAVTERGSRASKGQMANVNLRVSGLLMGGGGVSDKVQVCGSPALRQLRSCRRCFLQPKAPTKDLPTIS